MSQPLSPSENTLNNHVPETEDDINVAMEMEASLDARLAGKKRSASGGDDSSSSSSSSAESAFKRLRKAGPRERTLKDVLNEETAGGDDEQPGLESPASPVSLASIALPIVSENAVPSFGLPMNSFAPAPSKQPTPSVAVVKREVKGLGEASEFTMESFCSHYCGRAGGLNLYYQDIIPSRDLKVDMYVLPEAAREKMWERTKAHYTMRLIATPNDDKLKEEYNKKKANKDDQGRFPSLSCRKGFFQAKFVEDKSGSSVSAEDEKKEAAPQSAVFDIDALCAKSGSGGNDKQKKKGYKTLFGRRLPANTRALFMTPPMVAGFMFMTKKGNMGGKGQYDPTELSKADHKFSLSDKPIAKPGYDVDGYNPYAKAFMRYVNDTLEPEIYKQIWEHDNFAKSEKLACVNKAKSLLSQQLEEEKRFKTVDAAEKFLESQGRMFRSPAEKSAVVEQMLELKRFDSQAIISDFIAQDMEGRSRLYALRDKVFAEDRKRKAVVGPAKEVDPNIKRCPNVMWFKHSIFERVSDADKQAAVRERYYNGHYDSLPQEYKTEIENAGGKLDYNGVLVFRMKTEADLIAQGEWKNDPYPVKEMTWEERETLKDKEFVMSAIFQMELTENSQGKVGILHNNVVAVVVFDAEPTYGRQFGGQSGQYQENPCFIRS